MRLNCHAGLRSGIGCNNECFEKCEKELRGECVENARRECAEHYPRPPTLLPLSFRPPSGNHLMCVEMQKKKLHW